MKPRTRATLLLFASALFALSLACAQSEPSTSDCLDAEGIGNIRAEWQDPSAEGVIDKYLGKTFCVQGEIASIHSSDVSINVLAHVEDADGLFISHIKGLVTPSQVQEYENEKAKELESWLRGKNKGDTIFARCSIQDFALPGDDKLEMGTPKFGRCILVTE